MKLAFLGTSEFAVPALQALVDAGHDVAAAYTRAPKPAGRGQKEQKTPVHRLADRLGLAVRTPRTLRTDEAAAEFKALDLDAGVVVSYGHILPKSFLEAPLLGCLNIHGSLLPRWRGAAPIQRALLAGDAETGVTIIRMDEGLDTGPMLLAESVPIRADTTAGSLHDGLAVLGARLIVSALDGLVAGTLQAVAQPADGVTYAHKLQREEGALDWRRPAAELERQVRAFDPWPGTYFDAPAPGGGMERIKLLGAALALAGGAPGTVSVARDGVPTVACGVGGMRLLRLQRPGKAPVDGAAFARGFPLAGTVLPPPAGGDAPAVRPTG
ncbi:methionyl-tRNA formyltransferase [Vineibacter terrae]|uniref:methionyl-tRNA formyltransferase n=1 Tax=Vineibacter terrae TaxID=2586908 RepID=UPI002E2F6EB6|nr:methionyl-tRNA formyltransferase [Vineibacter terrae]HEX2891187.1 methionyl-tRNA formyltransferase [Vineibacter terrae]